MSFASGRVSRKFKFSPTAVGAWFISCSLLLIVFSTLVPLKASYRRPPARFTGLI